MSMLSTVFDLSLMAVFLAISCSVRLSQFAADLFSVPPPEPDPCCPIRLFA